ncbi:MAG: flagellar basal body rod protein FlgB [Desulfobacterales bacterium]|jgi:flagellar basal-body rod protein FlgB
METFKLCGGSIELLSRALDVRSSSHNVIVSNIANADTPNYKAFHVEVEKEMEKFTANPGRLQMRRTQPAHMPVAAVSEVRGTTRVSHTPQFSLRGDGNTVDIDRSMADLAENNLLYNAAAQIIQQKFQALKSAILGGNGGK